MNEWDVFLRDLQYRLELKATIFVLSPFFEDQARQVIDGAAAIWIWALTSAKGNPYQARLQIQGLLEGFTRTSAEVTSRRSVGRSLTLPEEQEFEDPMYVNVDAMMRITDKMTDRQVRMASQVIKRRGWAPEDVYVTIDGRLMPFWGVGSRSYNKKMKQVERLSSSGLMTSGAFRSKKDQHDSDKPVKGVAKWDGTESGHHWLHLTIHHWKTKESIPLVTSFRSGTKESQLKYALKQLARLPVDPCAVMFDKEFTHGWEGLKIVRKYADPRGVWIIGPMQDDAGADSIRRMREAWPGAHFIDHDADGNDIDESIWINQQHHVPPTDASAAYQEVYVYVLDQLRPDLSEKFSKHQVSTAHTGQRILGIRFYANRPVPEQLYHWYATAYSRRWACEALFQRHAYFMGASQSPHMPTRHFGYAAAFLILGVYGVWRHLNRDEDQDDLERLYTDDLSHTAFFSRVRGAILRLFHDAQ